MKIIRIKEQKGFISIKYKEQREKKRENFNQKNGEKIIRKKEQKRKFLI